MKPRHLAIACATVLSVAAHGVRAQTVITLTNAGADSTSMDLTNTAVALSLGGVGGAVAGQAQAANNELNVVNLLGEGAVLGAGTVVPGAPMAVSITMMAGGTTTSLSTNNVAGAMVGAVNPVIGAAAGNQAWSGGYGALSASAMVGAAQAGGNNANSLSMAVAPGTSVNLSQGATGGSFGLSAVNTQFAAGAGAMVNGAQTGSGTAGGLSVPVMPIMPSFAAFPAMSGQSAGLLPTLSLGVPMGMQNAGGGLNTALLIGAGSVMVNQFAPSGILIQATNRGAAFALPQMIQLPVMK